jgi:hypothetical protein
LFLCFRKLFLPLTLEQLLHFYHSHLEEQADKDVAEEEQEEKMLQKKKTK